MNGRESLRDNLTNEKVKANFSNQFDLVNCAIKFAREIIKGRTSSAETENRNIAVQALIELTTQETKLRQ